MSVEIGETSQEFAFGAQSPIDADGGKLSITDFDGLESIRVRVNFAVKTSERPRKCSTLRFEQQHQV
jgi:hypothetical protein